MQQLFSLPLESYKLQPHPLPQINGRIKFIGAGEAFAVFCTDDNELYLTGDVEHFGQMDVDPTSPFLKMVSRPSFRAITGLAVGGCFFLVTNGKQIAGIGSNLNGELGLQNTKSVTEFVLAVTDSFLSSNSADAVTQMSCGQYHSAIVISDRDLYMTGCNSGGQLCMNEGARTEFTLVQNSKLSAGIKQVQCGGMHTVILTRDRRLFAAGWNLFCALGFYGDSTSELHELIIPDETFTQLQLTSRCNRTAVLTQSNNLYTCGRNDTGQSFQPRSSYVNRLTLVKLRAINQRVVFTGGGMFSAIIASNGNMWVVRSSKTIPGKVPFDPITEEITMAQSTSTISYFVVETRGGVMIHLLRKCLLDNLLSDIDIIHNGN